MPPASPRSLAFSPAVHQSINGASSSSRRDSLGSAHQLPLPTTLDISASTSRRPPVGVTVSSTVRPNTPQAYHARGLSAASVSGPPHPPQPPPAFPTHLSPHTFHLLPQRNPCRRYPASSSFFRPSRPPQPEEFSRPNSVSSFNAAIQGDSEVYPLSPISKQHSRSSDDHARASTIGGEEADHFVSLKRMKQSREPLLPIGARPGLAIRSPIIRERSGGSIPLPMSPTTRNIVRNSFDRVMHLSRGLSFESIRKSSSRPGPDRPTDPKLSDEEQGAGGYEYDRDLSTASRSRFKRSTSPNGYHNGHSTSQIHSSSSSPDVSFNPTPPNHDPPLSAMPVVDTNGTPLRRYQLHPSRNWFFFRGRILTGGDSPLAFIATFMLLLGIAGVWFGTTCVWWWENESPAVAGVGAYLALLTVSNMLATAFRDPGIIPRDLDPEPPYPATSPSDGGPRAPMPRDLKVRSDVVRVKYCPTCRTYRPPRSSHCKMCDNCVDDCDHHCQWVNNCIGRRNYTTFFLLLLSATTTLVLVIVTSALHLWLLTKRENINFRSALARGVGSAVVFSVSIAVIWPVSALLAYHMRLLLLNITTIEQIRNQAHKTLVPGPPPPNPFSHGSWKRNLLAVLCRPQGYSWLNLSAVATEDKREVNPGLLEVDGAWDGSSPTTRETVERR
ncbi:DHHC palmitoyltransferase-domain-containing protein [Cyathus striatus]|nr:DHHC palmitoyltransferase-domain-containing protein [Cyathus striatus]